MTESSRLDELLDAWEVARDEGRTVSPEELCADAPELLESLRMRVAALEMIDQQFKTPDTDATTDLPTQRNEPPPEHPDVVIDGDYGRLTFHARGGLGAVYRGVDRRLKRDVAIKFLGQQVAGDAEARDQFALEAEITSRLDHPGIVPIYGLGTADDGRPCYAMRFIEGETLDDAIARFHRREPAFAGRGGEPSGLAHATTPASSATPDSERFDGRNIAFRRLLGNFVAVCRTIAYAHNRGIAHRDIKPSNVMLGKFGETLVVDWGLARRVGREAPFKTDHFQSLVISKPSQATPTESGVGTPAYMSPEQITAPLEVRQATDIYSLGATLYKLLTGRVPVHAQSLSEQLRRVSAGELEPPSKHVRGLPGPLEAVCLKALALNPDDRYETATELADEIERYLADERVTAYRESATRAFARWARRHRQAVQFGIGGLFALLVVAVGFSFREARLATRAESAREAGLIKQAELAANAVGMELGQRLLILENAARNGELRDLVMKAIAAPEEETRWADLSDWLVAERDYWTRERAIETYAWFVNIDDGDGTQVGRAPFLDGEGQRYGSIGTELDHRDYFHGLGPIQTDKAERRPIRVPHLAAPFKSSNDAGTPVLTLSVPVYGADGVGPLAVLGMAYELNDVSTLGGAGAAGTAATTLVHVPLDTYIKSEPGRGLIVQHPALADGAAFTPHRVPASLLEQVGDERRSFLLDQSYADPVAATDGRYIGDWLAAAAPVQIPGRDDEVAKTGWWVLRQERP